MKKIFKSKFFSFILGALTFGFISVVFAYSYVANEISTSSLDTTWNVDNVSEALDWLRHNEKYANYSLTERKIGKWIDGRAVFEKVVPVTLPTATTGIQIAHNISDFGGLVKMYLIWYDTSDRRWFTGSRYYYGGGGGYSIASEAFAIDETYISLSGIPNTINWSVRTTDAYVVVQYVKK